MHGEAASHRQSAQHNGWRPMRPWQPRRRKVAAVLCALAAATVRLLFWHCLQPVLYFAALDCHWDEIDSWQVRRRAFVRE